VADTPTPTLTTDTKWGTDLSEQDREALATLPNGHIGRAFWPPARLRALRRLVKYMALSARLSGLDAEQEALVFMALATAGSIPEPLIVTVLRQDTESGS